MDQGLTRTALRVGNRCTFPRYCRCAAPSCTRPLFGESLCLLLFQKDAQPNRRRLAPDRLSFFPQLPTGGLKCCHQPGNRLPHETTAVS